MNVVVFQEASTWVEHDRVTVFKETPACQLEQDRVWAMIEQDFPSLTCHRQDCKAIFPMIVESLRPLAFKCGTHMTGAHLIRVLQGMYPLNPSERAI
jgi:hypothetical protein